MSSGSPTVKAECLVTLRACAAAFGGEVLAALSHPAPLREVLRLRAQGRAAGNPGSLPVQRLGARAALLPVSVAVPAGNIIAPSLYRSGESATSTSDVDALLQASDPLALASGRLTAPAAAAAGRALRHLDRALRPLHEALTVSGRDETYESMVGDATAGGYEGQPETEADAAAVAAKVQSPWSLHASSSSSSSIDASEAAAAALTCEDASLGQVQCAAADASDAKAWQRCYDCDESPEPVTLPELWQALRREAVFSTDDAVTAQGVLTLRAVTAALYPDCEAGLWPLVPQSSKAASAAKSGGCGSGAGGCGSGAGAGAGGCCGGAGKSASATDSEGGGCCKTTKGGEQKKDKKVSAAADSGCCGGSGSGSSSSANDSGCCGGSSKQEEGCNDQEEEEDEQEQSGGCCGGGGCGSKKASKKETGKGLLSASSFAAASAFTLPRSPKAEAFLLPLLSDCVAELRVPDARLARSHARALVLGPLAASRAALSVAFPHVWGAIKNKWGSSGSSLSPSNTDVSASSQLLSDCGDDDAQGGDSAVAATVAAAGAGALSWPVPGAAPLLPAAATLPLLQQQAIVELVSNLWLTLSSAMSQSESALLAAIATNCKNNSTTHNTLGKGATIALARLSKGSTMADDDSGNATAPSARFTASFPASATVTPPQQPHPLQTAAREALGMLLSAATATTATVSVNNNGSGGGSALEVDCETAAADAVAAASALGAAAAGAPAPPSAAAAWAQREKAQSLRAAALLGLRALATFPSCVAFVAPPRNGDANGRSAGCADATTTANETGTETETETASASASAETLAQLSLPGARAVLLRRSDLIAATLAVAAAQSNVRPSALAAALTDSASAQSTPSAGASASKTAKLSVRLSAVGLAALAQGAPSLAPPAQAVLAMADAFARDVAARSLAHFHSTGNAHGTDDSSDSENISASASASGFYGVSASDIYSKLSNSTSRPSTTPATVSAGAGVDRESLDPAAPGTAAAAVLLLRCSALLARAAPHMPRLTASAIAALSSAHGDGDGDVSPVSPVTSTATGTAPFNGSSAQSRVSITSADGRSRAQVSYALAPAFAFSRGLAGLRAVMGANPLLVPLAEPVVRGLVARCLPGALRAESNSNAAAASEAEAETESETDAAAGESALAGSSASAAVAGSTVAGAAAVSAVAVLTKPLTAPRTAAVLLSTLIALLRDVNVTTAATAAAAAAAANAAPAANRFSLFDPAASKPAAAAAPGLGEMEAVAALLLWRLGRDLLSMLLLSTSNNNNNSSSIGSSGENESAARSSSHVFTTTALCAASARAPVADATAVLLRALTAAAPAAAQARFIAPVAALFLGQGIQTGLAAKAAAVARRINQGADNDCDDDDDEDDTDASSIGALFPLAVSGDCDPETVFPATTASSSTVSANVSASAGDRKYPVAMAAGHPTHCRLVPLLALLLAALRPDVVVALGNGQSGSASQSQTATLMTALTQLALSANPLSLSLVNSSTADSGSSSSSSASADSAMTTTTNQPHLPWLAARFALISLTLLLPPQSPLLAHVTDTLLPYLLDRAHADSAQFALAQPKCGALGGYLRSSALKTAACLLHALVQRGALGPAAPATVPLLARFVALTAKPDSQSASAASSTDSVSSAAAPGSVVDVRSAVEADWRVASQAAVALSALASPNFFALAASAFSPNTSTDSASNGDADASASAAAASGAGAGSVGLLATVAHFRPPPFIAHRYFAFVLPLLSPSASDATTATVMSDSDSASASDSSASASAVVPTALRQLSLTLLLSHSPLAAAAPALQSLLPALIAGLGSQWGALRLATVTALFTLFSPPQSAAGNPANSNGNVSASASADAMVRAAAQRERAAAAASVAAALVPHAPAAVAALAGLATATGAGAPAAARVTALRCLALLASGAAIVSGNPHSSGVGAGLLAPAARGVARAVVIKAAEAAAADRKVAVRLAAVRCKAKWLLVPAPGNAAAAGKQ